MFSLFLGATLGSPLRAEVTLPIADQRDAIAVQSGAARHWRQGLYEVWEVSGGCEVRQGNVTARGRDGVLWVQSANPAAREPHKVIAYLEGNVTIDYGGANGPHRVTGRPAQTVVDKAWLGRFHSLADVEFLGPTTAVDAPGRSAILERALAARDSEGRPSVRQAQFTGPGAPTFGQPSTLPPPANWSPLNQPFANAPVETLPLAAPRPTAAITKIEARNSTGFNPRTFPVGEKPQGIAIDSGVRIVLDQIDNVAFQGYTVTRTELETDRIVIWTDELAKLNLGIARAPDEPGVVSNNPVEIYMEGNIVFREGDRVIYADRMYYNVTERYGVVLNAEMLTPVPSYKGLLRLKADVLQQVDREHFQAYGAALTSSRLGVPRYWFQADNLSFEDSQRPVTNPFTNQPALDPTTGEPAVEHNYLATSNNNWVYLGGVPVFYWPTMATNLDEPTYFVNGMRMSNDRVFGTQLYLDFNAYQLLGIRKPPAGTQWTLSTDFLSDRGPALGTDYHYASDTFFGIPGSVRGIVDAWGLRDSGLDNLGLDRRALVPEEDFRGRILWQHRQNFGDGYQFTAELGLISDRNFLEQYYERQWDQNKDQTTGLELKRYVQNSSWAISSDARVNQFFTQTEWLPRFDHYLLGQSTLFDTLTWHAHSSVGYAKMKTASTPTDPTDAAKFQLLAWEANREGLRVATRHELDLPLELGPVKVVPYVLGEAAHWGENLTGQEVTRFYGQAGIRTSLPMWSANNNVQSELFNLDGLAHKITLEGDMFYADSNQNMNQFPLYDPLDDDSIEHFRRRFFFNTFKGVSVGYVPTRFDERYYALRSGLQSWVTSPSTEIADDLAMARVGVKQRWQTKRGLPGQQRIVDWVLFDVTAALYPKPNRDNFGQEVGLVEYDFRWHVGDRLTLLSDGFADVFGDGLRMASVGGLISRPEQGSVFVGFRTIDGPNYAGALTPLHSNILTATINYRMNEKWIMTGGASKDFGPAGSIGQIANFTRIGESFLVKVGFNYDVSRNNLGANFLIEPRFLPSKRLGRVGGVNIPTAGALGLE